MKMMSLYVHMNYITRCFGRDPDTGLPLRNIPSCVLKAINGTLDWKKNMNPAAIQNLIIQALKTDIRYRKSWVIARDGVNMSPYMLGFYFSMIVHECNKQRGIEVVCKSNVCLNGVWHSNVTVTTTLGTMNLNVPLI